MIERKKNIKFLKIAEVNSDKVLDIKLIVSQTDASWEVFITQLTTSKISIYCK